MTDTNVPAFPVPNDANVNGQEGMTLRDYFAAKALQGICANQECNSMTNNLLAGHAYEIADAMLEARQK